MPVIKPHTNDIKNRGQRGRCLAGLQEADRRRQRKYIMFYNILSRTRRQSSDCGGTCLQDPVAPELFRGGVEKSFQRSASDLAPRRKDISAPRPSWGRSGRYDGGRKFGQWRRGWDSNPRYARRTTVFETAPFDRSGTSPQPPAPAFACGRRFAGMRRAGARTGARTESAEGRAAALQAQAGAAIRFAGEGIRLCAGSNDRTGPLPEIKSLTRA